MGARRIESSCAACGIESGIGTLDSNIGKGTQMLAKRKIPAKSFQSWIGSQNLPDKVPEPLLSTMVARLRDGDMDVSHYIVMGHVRLAAQIVGRYLWKHNHKTDDLVSAAMFGICQAVKWAADGRMYDNRITPYIVQTIHRYIQEYLEHDHIVPIPRKEFSKKMRNQEHAPYYYWLSANIDGDEENTEYISNDAWQTYEPRVEDVGIEIEFNDLCEHMLLSDMERKIIDMRIEDYTLKEIGEKLGTSHQYIEQILHGLKERYLRRERLENHYG